MFLSPSVGPGAGGGGLPGFPKPVLLCTARLGHGWGSQAWEGPLGLLSPQGCLLSAGPSASTSLGLPCSVGLGACPSPSPQLLAPEGVRMEIHVSPCCPGKVLVPGSGLGSPWYLLPESRVCVPEPGSWNMTGAAQKRVPLPVPKVPGIFYPNGLSLTCGPSSDPARSYSLGPPGQRGPHLPLPGVSRRGVSTGGLAEWHRHGSPWKSAESQRTCDMQQACAHWGCRARGRGLVVGLRWERALAVPGPAGGA